MGRYKTWPTGHQKEVNPIENKPFEQQVNRNLNVKATTSISNKTSNQDIPQNQMLHKKRNSTIGIESAINPYVEYVEIFNEE